MKEDYFNNTKPFLKWAGGKRWLVKKYPHVFCRKYKRYFEPFLGSGAVYFHLNPKRAVLSDINNELIDTYQSIKINWKFVVKHLKEHEKNHSINYYYWLRCQSFKSPFKRASRFIYLNRTCWNGLYRVNRKGLFNVPIGTKQNIFLSTDNFELVSRLLKNTLLLKKDFEETINMAKEGDLVFVDPPYTIKHKDNGFLKYNENLFSWNDQERLQVCLYKAKKRGVIIVATNADHKSILELYKSNFNLLSVSRASIIAAKSAHRRKCSELIILSN